jgi:hypothetical protein
VFRLIRIAACGLLLSAVASPVFGARPIVDPHKLDASFAMFASDSSVPWRATAVRLDTYSSAPVDFAVYRVDPEDVLTAGSNARPRAVDTRRLAAIARWQFTPPGGYQYQSNAVDVPLGDRQGFFIVEARRANVGEQVWINRTRVGLLSMQTPADITLYGADLGTGRALARMRVQLLLGDRFVARATDVHGILRWTAGTRPLFALAQWGDSYAFVSFLPQAPLPSAIVGVRVGSAIAHPGDTVTVAGFARTRVGGALRVSRGSVSISIRAGATSVAQTSARLDASGAFTANLAIPPDAAAGDYAVLAQAGAGIGGASLHVDANANGLALSVAAQCEGACDPAADVPVVVRATREAHPAAGVAVHASVVRSPHDADVRSGAIPWGISRWLDVSTVTGVDGTAVVTIPHPTDGLASTYGIRADSGGATADTRVVVPTARIALQLAVDRDQATLGSPVNFNLSATDVASGRPVANLRVRVQLVHGSSITEQSIALDAGGRARGTFAAPSLGTSLVLADATAGGATASDAAQVEVVAQAPASSGDDSNPSVGIATDRARYRAGDTADVSATDRGAVGDALLSFESALGVENTVIGANEGTATASFAVTNAPGQIRVGGAFVRDGSLEWNAIALAVDAPGRPIDAPMAMLQSEYAPGQAARFQLDEAHPVFGTLVVRLSRGAPSGGAVFDSLPDLLAIGVAATQSSAPSDPTWHAWADSTGGCVAIQGFTRRTTPPADVSLAQSDSAAVYWNVSRNGGGPIVVPMPDVRGRYVLSILKMDDDGRVMASSSNVVVR